MKMTACYHDLNQGIHSSASELIWQLWALWTDDWKKPREATTYSVPTLSQLCRWTLQNADKTARYEGYRKLQKKYTTSNSIKILSRSSSNTEQFLTLSSFTHVTNSLFSPVFTCWVFYQNTFVYFVCFTFQSPSELGEIHISMSYYPTLDRLTIIVLRASNLKKMEPHGTGDRE